MKGIYPRILEDERQGERQDAQPGGLAGGFERRDLRLGAVTASGVARLLVVHEAVQSFGAGAEVAARVGEVRQAARVTRRRVRSGSRF